MGQPWLQSDPMGVDIRHMNNSSNARTHDSSVAGLAVPEALADVLADGGDPPQVDGFDRLEVLGRGARTVVYRVRKTGTDGPDYAMKMVRVCPPDAETALTAFRREAALLACATSPGLATIHDVGAVAGHPYLIMELVEGRTLAHLLAEQRSKGQALHEQQVMIIARDVADALAAAHRGQLVHRDIKPQNLLVTPEGHTRLIDLGLATWVANGATDGDVAGTFQYSPPEQSGMLQHPVDARSDLYALGVVLFECVAGRLPFVAEDVGELLHLHASTAPPDLAELRPDLSGTLVRIIAKLLAKDPDDRYQSAVGLAADVRVLVEAGNAPLTRLDTAGAVWAAGHTGPLVGRGREMARLIARWQRAQLGHGGIALVRGSAGAGRGRLAHEFAADVRARGTLVLLARCNPDDVVPAAAFRRAVEDHLTALQRVPEARRREAIDAIRRAGKPLAGLLGTLSPELRQLLGAPADAAGDRQEQFATAVSEFITELARLAGGALLVIEDVPWLDPVGRSIVHHLAAASGATPLLMVGTGESDGQDVDAAMDELVAELGPSIDLQVTLEPLGRSEVAALVAAQLGGGQVPAELARQLTIRSDGNPLAVVEYVRSLVEAGAVHPSWGTWEVSDDALDKLRLPPDVVTLMVSRLDAVDDTVRRCLAAAAVQGGQFDVGVVGHAIGIPESSVRDAVASAARLRIVDSRGDGRHAFVHQEVRRTLLDTTSVTEIADLHERIAEGLEAAGTRSDESIYELARHRMAAGRERAPGRAHEACLAAGRLLLRQHAPAEAVTFFEEARAAAELAGVEPRRDAQRDHATALLRAGSLDSAQDRLRGALDYETDRLERARLFELLARVRFSASDAAGALKAVGAGMTELGRRWPRSRALLVLIAVARFVTGLLRGSGRQRSYPARRRERHAVETALLLLASDAASLSMDEPMMAAHVARALHPANRLGPSAERIGVLARLGVLASASGRQRYATRLFARARREAMFLADPAIVAEVEYRRAVAFAVVSGRPDALIDHSHRHGRWLPIADNVRTVAFAATLRQTQGYAVESKELIARALGLVGDAASWLAFPSMLGGASVRSLLGAAEEAAADLGELRAALSDPGRPPEHHLYAAWTGVIVAVERGDGHTHVDDAVADLEASEMPLGASLYAWSSVSVAFGRLAQAQVSDGAQRAKHIDQAKAALRVVRRGGRRFNLRASWLVARAWEAHLRGRPRTARRRLARADDAVQHLDAPILAYELARLRARMLQSEGHASGAMREAQIARSLAAAGGWAHRERWIREEFDTPGSSGASDSVHSVHPATTTHGTEVRLRRRLDALQAVSAAAASVLDRHALIRVVLDATLRILPAERAFLFLADDTPDGTALKPHLGRTAEGEDLDALSDYSATLVERVCASHEGLVVTGTSEGAALGSESTVLHGLRSILIAPLLLKGRLVGVLYLDSRVAKGIFAPDDGEMLTAIGNQIAASLETARAAQLEVTVRTAWQQRDLAERLRHSMTELSGTLEPDQVLRRLLATVVGLLPGEHACLLRLEGSRVRLVAASGAAADTGEAVIEQAGVAFAVGEHPGLQHVMAAEGPVVGGDDRMLPPPLPDDLAGMLGHPRSWLAVPLSARDERIGVVVAGSTEPHAYGEADTTIAAALAGQANVAYDNAQLFTRVRELATTDMLTGLNNRDHFWHLAGQLIAAATRYGRPLAALMLDIDHFKEVNDTYGHAVGDDVLRVVASRLDSVVRSADVLGRSGGEEFAVLLPESGDAEALAERLRATVSATPVVTDAGPIVVTISVGIAQLLDGDDLDALLARADAAMYRSKAAGRDQVTVA